MALTVATCRTRAKALLDAPGSSSISNAMWLGFIQEAVATVYRAVKSVNSDYFVNGSTITYPANTEFIVLAGASYINSDLIDRIVGIDRYDVASPTPGVDIPVKLAPMRFAERTMYYRPVAQTVNGVVAPTHYCLVNSSSLYVAPIPLAAVTLVVYYSQRPTLPTADADYLPVPHAFDDAVVHCAAWLADSRTGGKNPAVSGLWASSQQDIATDAAARQDDEPNTVRYIPDVDYECY